VNAEVNTDGFSVQLHFMLRLFSIRSLSQELQEDVIRVLANGNLLLKAAKQLMPGIAGLGPRTGVSQQQIGGLPAGLNSQVRLLHNSRYHDMFSVIILQLIAICSHFTVS